MIFVDAGPLLARYVKNDSYHRLATDIWRELAGTPLATSIHVLDETFTLLGRRTDYGFAADRAERIYSSSVWEILSTTREDEIEAIQLFRKFSDQRVSFTDCLSFALMRRNRMTTVFTFDLHFVQAGFKVIGLG